VKRHQEKVIEELEALKKKSSELSSFVYSNASLLLPRRERDLMVMQLATMVQLIEILHCRIALFNLPVAIEA
tara:strand:- start:33 stop:248 length:216 start_codon:yes stop_codon:yes gene_type:complete